MKANGSVLRAGVRMDLECTMLAGQILTGTGAYPSLATAAAQHLGLTIDKTEAVHNIVLRQIAQVAPGRKSPARRNVAGAAAASSIR